MIRFIRKQRYVNVVDLTGKDLISKLGARKSTLADLLPFLLPREEMHTAIQFGRGRVSMAGETPDEVHLLPNATSGEFYRLEVWLRKGVVINLCWCFRRADFGLARQ